MRLSQSPCWTIWARGLVKHTMQYIRRPIRFLGCLGGLFALIVVCSVPTDAQQTVQRGQCRSTDIVFVLDDTFSLEGALYDMRLEIGRIIDLVEEASGGDFRMGLVTFKDSIDVVEDLNAIPTPQKKLNRLRAAIRALRAGAGSAGPEASDEALRTVIQGLPSAGRSQSGDFNGRFTARTRIVILVTDNLPGGFDDRFVEGVDDKNAQDVAQAAVDRNITISTIYVPTSFFGLIPGVETIMREYAAITGGLFSRVTTTGQGTAEAIASIIRNCGRQPMV